MAAASPPPPGSGAAAVDAILRADRHDARRGRLRHWSIGLALVAGLALWGYWLWGTDGTATVYLTEPARLGDLTVVVTATGSIEPTNKVEISSELSGTVRAVHVDYNSVVTPGQVLAELDTDRLEAEVASAEARLAAAHASVDEALATIDEKRGDYERRQALAQRSVASLQDLAVARAAFERAVAAHAHALAQVRVAEADLDLARTQLAKACICAPIDGIVLERNVDPGQTVAASLQAPVLFTIAEDLREMELRVDIDEADVGTTRVGQRASFTVDAYPGRSFPARIRDIRFAPETVQGVVTYKGILTIDNTDMSLRPGMTATAEIVVEEVAAALLVPNAALRFSPPATEDAASSGGFLSRILPRPPGFRPPSRAEDDGPERTVWVLRDSVPAPVAVRVGSSDGRFTQVLDGELDAGDPVIVDTVTAGA